MKIATHDSVTGEKGLWYCLPLVPFARTQSKTIKEQYEAGCRSFDIRIKHHAGTWRCAHGWWFTKKSAFEIFNEINEFPERCQVCITFEGRETHNEEFLLFIGILKSAYTNIIYGNISVKYGRNSLVSGHKTNLIVNYQCLEKADTLYEGGKQGFIPLDGSNLGILLPIPWLLNKLFTRHHKFNNNYFIYVDFL